MYTASCYAGVVARTPEDPLVAKLFDGKKQHDDIARAIEQLSPEEAEFFLHKLEAAFRKRKIQLSGYLVAMVAWLAGMTMALIYFGMHDVSSAWAFLLPFAIVGVILYAFGIWADRVGRAAIPSASARRPRGASRAPEPSGSPPESPSPG